MKKYLKKLKAPIILRLITNAFYIVAIAGIPYIIKKLLDYDFSKGIKGVITLIIGYLAIITIGMIFQYFSQLLNHKINQQFYIYIKKDLFNSITKNEYINFIKKDVSHYVSILNNDIPALKQYIDSSIIILESVTQIIVYAFYMFMLDYRIALSIIFFSTLSLFLPNITSLKLSSKKAEYMDKIAVYMEKVTDLLKGFKNINSRTRDNIQNEHNYNLENMENSLFLYGKYKAFTNVFNGFFMYLLDFSAFVTVAIFLFLSKITIGTATAALSYIKEFVYPIREIISNISEINSVKSVKGKIENILQYKSKDLDIKENFTDNIKIENICIDFEGFSLKNATHTFIKNKKYAIIGQSGSGKSLILNTLAKMQEINSGVVKIDDKDINLLDTSKIIFFISQFEHIFTDTFKNNATVYNTYDESNLKEVTNKVNSNKIFSIQNTENCSSLSGGEKQLLSLVKMLVSNTEIFLMDEPFSALDINQTLIFMKKMISLIDKTLIMVTHHVSKEYLELFDEVLIIENGHIVEAGLPDKIMNTDAYKRLVRNF